MFPPKRFDNSSLGDSQKVWMRSDFSFKNVFPLSRFAPENVVLRFGCAWRVSGLSQTRDENTAAAPVSPAHYFAIIL